jgi:hypothetical protein
MTPAHDPVDVVAERGVHRMKERNLVILALVLTGFICIAFVILRPSPPVAPVSGEHALQAVADAWNAKVDQMREDRATRELSEIQNRAQDAQRRAVFDRCIESGADTITGCSHRAASPNL